MERVAALSSEDIAAQVAVYASTLGLTCTANKPDSVGLDTLSITFVSELARRSQLALPAFVRLLRGQTKADSRPNKQLFELSVPSDSAVDGLYRQWNSIVLNGVSPPARQRHWPANHSSLHGSEAIVRRHIRNGQLDGRYLIFDESILVLWPEVFFSPIGVVEKVSPDGRDIRIINDYSFPREASVNDFTMRNDFPAISYNPPRDIALRIHELRTRHPGSQVLIMLGDVSGAFRHVPIHEDSVHMFAFRFDGYVVIDLSCGFGWCASPAYYAVAGSIINHMYSTSRPLSLSPLDSSAFVGNVWCDDHTCVEVDSGGRCAEANISLRSAMAAVLGPTAINEKKFTKWSTTNKALGLLWDTHAWTVSIPDDKLDKAQSRVDTILSHGRASKTDLNRLLGVLRHVASCFPAARSFYQRIHVAAASMLPFNKQMLQDEAVENLRWFRVIISRRERFNRIPLEQFARVTTPSVHVYMDASDSGLCALDPSRRVYLRLEFTSEERDAIAAGELSINVRELRSAVLAALLWGPHWRLQAITAPTFVCFHIDNTSAVAWSNRRSSRHPTAQLYNRLLSMAEFQYQLCFSSEHIPGVLNVMADAGSRAWTDSHPLWTTWTNLCSSWQQTTVVPPFTDLFGVWDACCVTTHSLDLPTPSTELAGLSGAASPG